MNIASLSHCLTCKGAKQFRWYADPVTWGETDEVVYECPCRDQYRLSRFLADCNVMGAQARMCWGDARYADQRDKDAVQGYCDGLGDWIVAGVGLFFHGPSDFSRHGSGKSLFANLLLKRAIGSGYTGYFTTFQQLLSSFMQTWRDAARKQWFDRRVRAAQVLVIDDIGQEGDQRQVRAALDEILRPRVQEGLATFVTTNLSMGEFQARYSTALTSLLIGASQLVEFVGPDYRLKLGDRIKTEVAHKLTRPWTLQ